MNGLNCLLSSANNTPILLVPDHANHATIKYFYGWKFFFTGFLGSKLELI